MKALYFIDESDTNLPKQLEANPGWGMYHITDSSGRRLAYVTSPGLRAYLDANSTMHVRVPHAMRGKGAMPSSVTLPANSAAQVTVADLLAANGATEDMLEFLYS